MNPKRYIPGTTMNFGGVRPWNDRQRASLIAYLEEASVRCSDDANSVLGAKPI